MSDQIVSSKEDIFSGESKARAGKLLSLLAYPLIAVIGCLISLVLLEILIRIWIPFENNVYMFDPVLGHKRVPNDNLVLLRTEFQNSFKLNEYGWNDKSPALVKEPGVFRILVVGDSYVEGGQVKYEENFTRLIDKKLNANSKITFEVLNMGVAGYGTTQEYLLLRQVIPIFKPDMVILAFLTANDIRNNYFLLNEGTDNWLKATRPYLNINQEKSEIKYPGSYGRSKINRLGWKYEIYDSSRLLQTIHRFLVRSNFIADLMVKTGFLSKGSLLSLHGVPIDFQIYSNYFNDTWENAWLTTEDLLVRVKEYLEEQGVRLLVSVLNSREQLHDKDWEDVLSTYPEMKAISNWRRQLPNDRVVEILEKHNILYIDLLPPFRNRIKSGRSERLHYYLDGHWNPSGHELAANLITKEVLELSNYDFVYDK